MLGLLAEPVVGMATFSVFGVCLGFTRLFISYTVGGLFSVSLSLRFWFSLFSLLFVEESRTLLRFLSSFFERDLDLLTQFAV